MRLALVLLALPFYAFGQELPFVVTGNHDGAACSSVPWPSNTIWSVRAPADTDLVLAGSSCSSATVRPFGGLADSQLIVTCPYMAGDTAAQCSARGETSEPAGAYRTAPPPPPPPPTWSEGTADRAWAAPTQYTDGTPITGQVTYRVEQRTDTVPYATVANGLTVTTYLVTGLPAGTYYWRVYASVGGAESGPSVEASKVITEPAPPPPPPPPPAAVVVAVVPGLNMSPIFGVSSSNTRQTTVLGFVPVGAACTGPVVYTYRGQGYRRFNQSQAVWWSSTPTTNAAVACQ